MLLRLSQKLVLALTIFTLNSIALGYETVRHFECDAQVGEVDYKVIFEEQYPWGLRMGVERSDGRHVPRTIGGGARFYLSHNAFSADQNKQLLTMRKEGAAWTGYYQNLHPTLLNAERNFASVDPVLRDGISMNCVDMQPQGQIFACNGLTIHRNPDHLTFAINVGDELHPMATGYFESRRLHLTLPGSRFGATGEVQPGAMGPWKIQFRRYIGNKWLDTTHICGSPF